MPSVITMTSGMAASMASVTAALVPAGGTKTTETSAPVAAIASPTVPNTGTSRPPRSTVWPALRGLVPPTTLVPAAIIRRAVLAAFRAGDALDDDPAVAGQEDRHLMLRRGGSGQFGGAPRRVVHGGDLLDHGEPGLVEDAAALGGVVAVQPDHDRVADLLAARRPSMPIADTIPLATASQEVMPPNTLTSTLRTDGSDSTISRPFAITSADAPPPMSRKLAGRIAAERLAG